jgi:kinesin family protein 18/19
MQELFEKINERSEEKVTEVTLSYLEIYNETIRDLLVEGGSKTSLMLREDSNQAVSVAGLTSHRPTDVRSGVHASKIKRLTGARSTKSWR